ncbi:MAG: DNA-processing protein DprA, partial [candidate division Zixibacteria bacterium]
MNDEQLAIWALTRIKGLGPSGIRKLIEKYGNAVSVFESAAGEGYRKSKVSQNILGQLKSGFDSDEMKSDMLDTIVEGSEVVVFTEEEYPAKLKTIFDPPPVLYSKGSLDCLDGPTVAIVGSRKPSDYGRRMARKLAEELASAGVTIISGLAFGIDGCA